MKSSTFRIGAMIVGMAVVDGYDFCGSGDLAPGASCYVYVPNDSWASCSFQVTGKISASTEVRDKATTRPLFAVPATK
jgi:hypothetical protein